MKAASLLRGVAAAAVVVMVAAAAVEAAKEEGRREGGKEGSSRLGPRAVDYILLQLQHPIRTQAHASNTQRNSVQ